MNEKRFKREKKKQPRREDEEADQAPRQEEDEGCRPREEAPPAPKIEVLRVGIPLKGKGKEDVLSGAMDLYLQLKADGFPVQGIHTDRGREFMNSRFKQWTRSRCIMHTTNGGEDPQANGRVERAVSGDQENDKATAAWFRDGTNHGGRWLSGISWRLAERGGSMKT